MWEVIKALFTKDGRSLIDRLHFYDTEVNRLNNTIGELNNVIHQMIEEKRAYQDFDLCEFVVDWDIFPVFSIERRDNVTILGYWKSPWEDDVLIDTPANGKVVGEWYFICSIDKHNKLVEEFKQWKTGKSKTDTDSDVTAKSEILLEKDDK